MGSRKTKYYLKMGDIPNEYWNMETFHIVKKKKENIND